MLYDSEVDVKGINAYRFVLDPANLALTDDNKAFCIPNDASCLPYGLLNVERCYGMFIGSTFENSFCQLFRTETKQNS